MPHVPHIETAGMGHILSARAHRTCGIIGGPVLREMQGRCVMLRLSAESGAASFSRERDRVGEREVRRMAACASPLRESARHPLVAATVFELARNRASTRFSGAQQAGAGQPATRPEPDSAGSDRPQPEAEWRPR